MQTLYIIHGWTYTTKYWEKTISLLEKSGLKVEMLHVPGLTDPSDKIFTIEDYVSWAKKSIKKGSIVLGHSNGGRILLNLLKDDPAYLKGIILLNSAGIYEPSKKRDILRFLSKIFSPLKKIPLFRKIIHKLVGASDYDHAPENMKRTLENMLSSDKTLDISPISTPVRILWGEADRVTPLRQGQKLHSLLKNSTFESHPLWEHAPYIKDPSGLAASIESAYNSLKGEN